MQLSLNESDDVFEDGVGSVANKGACLEEVYTTHRGCLAHLLATGGESLDDCTQETTLQGEGGRNV